MLHQWSMFHFAITKNDGKNQYVFQLQPGSSWDEIQIVLEEFKAEFKQLQEQILKQEAEKESAESSAG